MIYVINLPMGHGLGFSRNDLLDRKMKIRNKSLFVVVTLKSGETILQCNKFRRFEIYKTNYILIKMNPWKD